MFFLFLVDHFPIHQLIYCLLLKLGVANFTILLAHDFVEVRAHSRNFEGRAHHFQVPNIELVLGLQALNQLIFSEYLDYKRLDDFVIHLHDFVF